MKILGKNITQNHKRTKSVNPTPKLKSNLVQTPKKNNIKMPLNKSNVNKSTSYNKQLDNSIVNGNLNEGSRTYKVNNSKNTNNQLYIQGENQNIHNEENSMIKKFHKERNPSAKKSRSIHKKDASVEKKGKFLV